VTWANNVLSIKTSATAPIVNVALPGTFNGKFTASSHGTKGTSITYAPAAAAAAAAAAATSASAILATSDPIIVSAKTAAVVSATPYVADRSTLLAQAMAIFGATRSGIELTPASSAQSYMTSITANAIARHLH
jgi:hypothetical protein